jgi:7 transmembrane sweet-taste receptor of 3 GCPR
VVDNYDLISSFVPRSHPRVLTNHSISNGFNNTALNSATLAFACIALTGVLMCGVGTYAQRKKRAIQRAQLEFLSLLILGLAMMGIAAILLTMQSTDGICTATLWMWSVGYTLEMVPLIVKIAAINRLMQAARAMRRIKLSRKTLFGVVFGLVAINVIFLVIWTAVDPPSRNTTYQLTGEVTDDGDTVVERKVFCSPQNGYWRMLAVAWQCLLLICATVLAWQTRNLRHDMNESETLALLIYSHFFFVLLRLCSFFLEDAFDQPQAVADFRSLLLSGDIFATQFIYFLPKLLTPDRAALSSNIRTTWMALDAIVRGSRASQASTEHRSNHHGVRRSKGDDDYEIGDLDIEENDDQFRVGTNSITNQSSKAFSAQEAREGATARSSSLPATTTDTNVELAPKPEEATAQATSDTSSDVSSGGISRDDQEKNSAKHVTPEVAPVPSGSSPPAQHMYALGLRCRHCGKKQ